MVAGRRVAVGKGDRPCEALGPTITCCRLVESQRAPLSRHPIHPVARPDAAFFIMKRTPYPR